MAKVLGVGGVFFKSADPAALRAWYAEVLGLESESWGAVFEPQALTEVAGSATVWAPFQADTTYFAPAAKDFMFNLIVDDLEGVLARCRQNGVMPLKLMPDEANGAFAHILDPEGNKIELWQPKPMA
ncbi:MAG TPA: VOC family protein [Caulobacterales bacterium]|nr:VOC family protein [Caulobacterales bacterium]